MPPSPPEPECPPSLLPATWLLAAPDVPPPSLLPGVDTLGDPGVDGALSDPLADDLAWDVPGVDETLDAGVDDALEAGCDDWLDPDLEDFADEEATLLEPDDDFLELDELDEPL